MQEVEAPGTSQDILVDRADDGVVTVTLNRPRVKNAIAAHMWEELRCIFQDRNS